MKLRPGPIRPNDAAKLSDLLTFLETLRQPGLGAEPRITMSADGGYWADDLGDDQVINVDFRALLLSGPDANGFYKWTEQIAAGSPGGPNQQGPLGWTQFYGAKATAGQAWPAYEANGLVAQVGKVVRMRMAYYSITTGHDWVFVFDKTAPVPGDPSWPNLVRRYVTNVCRNGDGTISFDFDVVSIPGGKIIASDCITASINCTCGSGSGPSGTCPLAAYRFDNNLLDSSGNAHTLTESGTAAFVTGLIGQAINTGGKTAGLSKPTLAAPLIAAAGAFSFSCWIKTNGTVSGHAQSAMSQVLSGTAKQNLGMTIAGKATFSATSAPTISSSASVDDSAWHHLVGTYDGANANLYVDGALAAGPTAQAFSTGATDFGVGNLLADLDFAIDLAFVYNVTLTAAEVTSLYNVGLGTDWTVICPGPEIINTPCCPDGVTANLPVYFQSASGTIQDLLTYDSSLNEWTGTYQGDATCSAAGVEFGCIGDQWMLTVGGVSITASSQSCNADFLCVQFNNVQDIISCSSGTLTVTVGCPPPADTHACVCPQTPSILWFSIFGITASDCVFCNDQGFPLTYNAAITNPSSTLGAWVGSGTLCGQPASAIFWCNGSNFGLEVTGPGNTNVPISVNTATCSPLVWTSGTANCLGTSILCLGFCPGSADAGGFMVTENGGGGGGGGGITRTSLGTANSAGAFVQSPDKPGVAVAANSKLVVVVTRVGLTSDNPIMAFNGVPMTVDVVGSGYFDGSHYISTYIFTLFVPTATTGDVIALAGTVGNAALMFSVVRVNGLASNALDLQNIASSAIPPPTVPLYSPTSYAAEYIQGAFLVFKVGGAPTVGSWDGGYATGGQDVSMTLAGTQYTLGEGYQVTTAIGTYPASLSGSIEDAWEGVIGSYD